MTEKRLAEYQRRILKECSTSASVGIVLRELIIEAQLEMAAQASPPTPDAEKEFSEPAEGCRIVRVYRNGVWVEENAAGERRRCWFTEPDDFEVTPEPSDGEVRRRLYEMRKEKAARRLASSVSDTGPKA